MRPQTGRAHAPAGDVAQVLYRGAPTERETKSAAKFKAGDNVRAKTIDPVAHTGCRAMCGYGSAPIEHVVGCHVFPDSNALGAGENPQWLYTVRFAGGTRGACRPDVEISVDAWEPYLVPA